MSKEPTRAALFAIILKSCGCVVYEKKSEDNIQFGPLKGMASYLQSLGYVVFIPRRARRHFEKSVKQLNSGTFKLSQEAQQMAQGIKGDTILGELSL